MDFGEKKIANLRVGFRVKASESEQRKTKRDAKNARRAFFVLKGKARSAKLAAKNFSFFLRKSPYFWGKKLRLLKKSIFIYRKSIKIYRKSINKNAFFLFL